MTKFKIKEELRIYLIGILMGVADSIPGISGGTIAFLCGIYERLIKTISSIRISNFLTFNFQKIKKELFKIDFKLLIPLVLGIGSSLFLSSHIISYILADYPNLLYSFFFGLILASTFSLFKNIKFSGKTILFLIIGFLIGFLISSDYSLKITPNYFTLFFSAIIAIIAMILPGISGAYILLMLNHYEYVINCIKNLEFIKLIIFGFGAFIGLLFFSRLIKKGFENKKEVIICFLIGLMLGSLKLLIIKSNFSYHFFENIVFIVEGFLIGILFYFVNLLYVYK